MFNTYIPIAHMEQELYCIGTYIIFLLYSRCGHCKKMAPEFDKASSVLLSNDPPIHLVKVRSPSLVTVPHLS